jgi:hypothetical protein
MMQIKDPCRLLLPKRPLGAPDRNLGLAGSRSSPDKGDCAALSEK